ncbi:hypothetical protein CAEBREN_16057 [Caenorhabditis brenneri]|uniref:SET domain-containing protein n=1 Tax=Caenorhabditis brenneri TaxID=135651 RepID=G0NDB7_CAEBE|nr:hypothetical protein CAEBREN_16057 [Caenorhabditis brenneri]
MPPKPENRKVSNEMRSAILKNCEKFPELSKHKMVGRKHENEYEVLCELVNSKFPESQHVDSSMVSDVIKKAKRSLSRKLNLLILRDRLTKSQVDDKMKTWEFYADFQFYRQSIQELEKEWWEKQAAGSVPTTRIAPGSSSSAASSTSSAPAPTSSTSAPASSSSAPTSSASGSNQGSSSARSAKLQIQKLNMALVKKGTVTGSLRSGKVVYARNTRSALRDDQKKDATTIKKRPVILRSAALTGAMASAAKLRKAGVKINAPSSVTRSRLLRGLAATNIIATSTTITRKRANQPEFPRTARLAARQEQQETRNDEDNATPEPVPEPDYSTSSTVVGGAKKMKIETSSTPGRADRLIANDVGSSSTQSGPSEFTPQAIRTETPPVDGTDADRSDANDSTGRTLRNPKAPAVGRFEGTGAAQPATSSVANSSARNVQIAVVKAEKPKQARAQSPPRGQAAVVAIDIAEQRSTLPLAVVIASDRNHVRSGRGRVKIVEEFVAEVPQTCTEAIRAMEFGKQIRNRQYPGIPDKKFLQSHYVQYGSDGSLTWPMQAAFEIKDHPNKWYVYFEGWTIPYKYEESQLMETGADTLMVGKIRREFLNQMATKDVAKDCLDQYRYSTRKTDALFWDYEDLSYFHTKIHYEDGLGPIFYMNLSKDCEKPPTYSYTTTNIMDVKVYNWCLRQEMNWPIQKLDEKNKLDLESVEKKTGCENPSGCVCNRRLAHFYENNTNLQTENGLLKVDGLNRDSPRISIECSDACGCSHNCPRRHLQRGNQKALVVNFEGSRKGMGLRAGASYKKGEFLGEYTGILKEPVAGEDQSYEAAVTLMAEPLVICARKCGNIMRFMSHSCSPNAMFIVTWSRVKESDPLFPKIAVFATKDIKMGEEITICYWTAADRDAATEFVRCWCGSTNCIQKLPAIS